MVAFTDDVGKRFATHEAVCEVHTPSQSASIGRLYAEAFLIISQDALRAEAALSS